MLIDGHFKKPAPCESLVVLNRSVPRDPAEVELQRLSPEEEHHAIILATARDVRRGLNIEEWAAIWVSMPVAFRVVGESSSLKSLGIEDGHLFFAASQLREKIGEDFESMYYTTVTWQL